ncbi:MAG: PorT family protein, partial [Chitinophagaceae bacterium]
MKKLLLSLLICGAVCTAGAQVVPSVQFGLKAGVNLAKLNTPGVFSSDNQAGFLGGV